MKIMWLETPEDEPGEKAESFQPVDGCPFCSPEVTGRAVEAYGTVLAIHDKFPVAEGHLLIIPKRHVPDYFSMSAEERRDMDYLLMEPKERLAREDPAICGFNAGTNTGIAAGQTVMHAHMHLIPRREGDTDRPRGGVRGVIDSKKDY